MSMLVDIYIHRWQANSRWYGIDYKIPSFAQRCRSYGATPLAAEDAMYKVLDRELGKHNYIIQLDMALLNVKPLDGHPPPFEVLP